MQYLSTVLSWSELSHLTTQEGPYQIFRSVSFRPQWEIIEYSLNLNHMTMPDCLGSLAIITYMITLTRSQASGD